MRIWGDQRLASINFESDASDFNKQPAIDRLLQFIRAEKPYFRAEIRPEDLKTAVCVRPKRSSPRVLVQAGAFLLFGELRQLDGAAFDGMRIERIAVDGGRKGDLLDSLDALGVNESAMFPEIDRAASGIRTRYTRAFGPSSCTQVAQDTEPM